MTKFHHFAQLLLITWT